jgi:two-component system response regulator RegA
MARVLIVEDDVGTLESFGRLLRYQGHEPMTAASGGQALEIVQAAPPEIILADLVLPDMTALDLIRELQILRIAPPSVVMTGFGTIESAVEAMKLGAVDYLQKPLFGDDLERAIERGLTGRTPPTFAIVRADGMARWAMAIASVVDSPHDPKNLADWSRIRGVAPDTLRTWCRTAHVLPKRSLDLARLLRAVCLSRSKGWPLERLLDAADHRTVERLLAAGGLTSDTKLPTLGQLLARQSLISDLAALDELRRVLRELGTDLES